MICRATSLLVLLALGCGSEEAPSTPGTGGASGGTAGATSGGSGGTGGATGVAAGSGGSGVPLADRTIFAAPSGTGTACTKAAPCDLWAAVAKAAAGDVVLRRHLSDPGSARAA